MNKVVAFFGSFNPPTNGHIAFANQILNTDKSVEKIIFIPVNNKYQKQGLIENEHRYEMLNLICEQNDRFSVSRIEIESDRAMYTFETLRILKEQYTDKQICFAIGSDNLKTIHTWKEAEELIDQYKIYVAQRLDDNIDEIIENIDLLRIHKNCFYKMPQNEETKDISSSLLKQKLSEGVGGNTLPIIEKYIETHELYGKGSR